MKRAKGKSRKRINPPIEKYIPEAMRRLYPGMQLADLSGPQKKVLLAFVEKLQASRKQAATFIRAYRRQERIARGAARGSVRPAAAPFWRAILGRANPPRDIFPEFRAGRLRSSSGKKVKKKSQAKAILLSELRAAGRIPPRANPKKPTKKKRKRNQEQTASELYRKFHGRGPNKVTDHLIFTQDPYGDHPEVSQLGRLVSLYIGEGIILEGKEGTVARAAAPEYWCEEISFSAQKAPQLVGAPGGKQLYTFGGDQNLNNLLKKLGVDPDKDFADLGFCYRIEYYTRKGFDNFQPICYWHLFGEETGVQPRLIYDRRRHLIGFSGGEYTIKDVGIVN